MTGPLKHMAAVEVFLGHQKRWRDATGITDDASSGSCWWCGDDRRRRQPDTAGSQHRSSWSPVASESRQWPGSLCHEEDPKGRGKPMTSMKMRYQKNSMSGVDDRWLLPFVFSLVLIIWWTRCWWSGEGERWTKRDCWRYHPRKKTTRCSSTRIGFRSRLSLVFESLQTSSTTRVIPMVALE